MPISKDEISYEVDLTEKLKKLDRSKRKEAKELIGNYLLDAILDDTANSKSPVTGARFKPLSKEYKKKKKSVVGHTRPDLRLFEKMLPNMKADNTAKGVKLKITKKSEIEKAYNHITGDTVPSRPFLPDDNGEAVKPTGGKGSSQFRTAIARGIDEIIESLM